MKGLIAFFCVMVAIVITSMIQPIQAIDRDVGLTTTVSLPIICDIAYQPVVMSDQVLIISYIDYDQLKDSQSPIVLCNVEFQLLVRCQPVTIALYNTNHKSSGIKALTSRLHHNPGDMLNC